MGALFGKKKKSKLLCDFTSKLKCKGSTLCFAWFFFSFSNTVLHCLYIVTCAKSGVMLSTQSYNLLKVIKIITTNAYNIRATVSQKKCMM